MSYLYELLSHAARSRPEHPAIDLGSSHVSYSEFLARVDHISKQLEIAGVSQRSRIAVAGSVGPWHLGLLMALASLDCAVVATSASEREAEANRFHNLSVSHVATCDETTGQLTLTDLAAPPTTVTCAEAYVISTSGSTGQPKDLVVRDSALRHYGEHLMKSGRALDSDRISLTYNPAFDAFYEVLILGFGAAATLVLPRGREHILVARFCSERRVTSWNSVPSQLAMAYSLGHLEPRSLDFLRLIVVGGEAISPELLQTIRAAAPNAIVVNAYGPAEATIGICEYVILPHQDVAIHDGRVSIGAAIQGVETRLHWSPTAGQFELLVRGPQRFDGYVDPRHNSRRFLDPQGQIRDGLRFTPGPEDWYMTGDLVTLESEHLFLLGRNDRTVKLMGKRVDLDEVERGLRGTCCIQDVAVEAINHEVRALAVRRRECRCANPTEGSGLRPYARPRTIIWVDAIPLLSSGKVDRRAVVRALEG